MMLLISLLCDFILIAGTTVMGFTLAMTITSQFVYSHLKGPLADVDFSCSDDSESDNEEFLEFEESYQAKFDELTTKARPEDAEITSYKSEIELPMDMGILKMCFDPETNTYQYYSDRRSIPIRFLNVAAQKFVIDNDCKVLFSMAADPSAADPASATDPASAADPSAADPSAADPSAADPSAADPTSAASNAEGQSYYNWFSSFFYAPEPASASASASASAPAPESAPAPAPTEPRDSEAEQLSDEEDDSSNDESVFATYKKNPEVQSAKKEELIVKVMNNYKYGGSLSDWDEDNQQDKEDKSLELSFSEYKEMVKNKTV